MEVVDDSHAVHFFQHDSKSVTARNLVRLHECSMNTIQTQLLESLNEFTAFVRKQRADPELAADTGQDSLQKAL